MASFPLKEMPALNRRGPEEPASKRPSPIALAGPGRAPCRLATTTWR